MTDIVPETETRHISSKIRIGRAGEKSGPEAKTPLIAPTVGISSMFLRDNVHVAAESTEETKIGAETKTPNLEYEKHQDGAGKKSGLKIKRPLKAIAPMTQVGISSMSLRDNVHVAAQSTKEIRAGEKNGPNAKTPLSPSVSNGTTDIRKFFF